MTRSWSSSPKSWVSGDRPGATVLNREIRDRFDYLYSPARVSVLRSSNQTFTVATDTVLSWSGVQYDSDTMWSAGSPTRLTVPTGWGGLWDIAAAVTFGSGSGGADQRCNMRLRVNGSSTFITDTSVFANTTSVPNPSISAARSWPLLAGDYVEVVFWTSGGYDEVEDVLSSALCTFMEMTWKAAT